MGSFRSQPQLKRRGWLRSGALLLPTWCAAWVLGANYGSFVPNSCLLVGVGYALGDFCSQRGVLHGCWERITAVSCPTAVFWWGLATFRGCFAPDMACCMGVGGEKRKFRAQQLSFDGVWLRSRALLLPTWRAAWGWERKTAISCPMAIIWWGLVTFRVIFAPNGVCYMGVGSEKRQSRAQWPLFGGGWLRSG